ncbi:hypothetical protein [Niallia sp. MER 6]|nr:hypothetical protein [Niallia sp. MER 6]MCM3034089.1 hypothetical protein [Niallia sp. MER 6]
MKINDLRSTEVIEIVESEPVLEIVTEQEQSTDKAYLGMINNALVGVGK